MLFVGLKDMALAIQAEGLMEQPLGALYIGEQRFPVRLVPGESKRHTVIHLDAVAELFFFGGGNVKKCKFVSENFRLAAVLYNMKQNAGVEMAGELFSDGETGKGFDRVYQLLMAVNMKSALIGSLVHAGGNHADNPDHAQDVVVVGVGHKDVVDAFQGDLLLFQGKQDAVSAAGVRKKIFSAFFQGETGVIAVDGLGVSGAQNNKFFHM